MMTRSFLSLICIASLSCASATKPLTSPAPSTPRSIILMIADGSGVAHFTVREAEDLYQVPGWGDGYYRITGTGTLAVKPLGPDGPEVVANPRYRR